MAWLRLMRPHQWVKNIFIFAGLIFGRRLFDEQMWLNIVLVCLGFLALSLVSSLVYVINDLHDREEDRLHPRKKNRPIASGEVSVSEALMLAGGLLVVGLGGAFALDVGFGIVAAAYLVLQLLYTFVFKHQVILDVISIGVGFVLRAVAGAVLVHVPISPWLVLCTFTLCLFMGFSKRRCELNALDHPEGHPAGKHRKTLFVYTPELLTHMITLTAGIAIVSFMLYTTDGRTKEVFGGGEIGRFGAQALLYTLPFVVYAVFRFAVLVEHRLVDGPTDVLLKDRPFQIALVCWTIAATLILYRTEMLYEGFGSAFG